MSINENKIKMNKDYIMIELDRDMELDLHESSLLNIGIQNGILHIEHRNCDVRFESVFREYDEITLIIIEPRVEESCAEDIIDKIRGTKAPLVDMSLVNQLKNHKKVDIT